MLIAVIECIVISGAASATIIVLFRSWQHYKIPPLCRDTFKSIRGDIKENKKDIEKNAATIAGLKDDTDKLYTKVSVLTERLEKETEHLEKEIKSFRELYDDYKTLFKEFIEVNRPRKKKKK